MLTHTARQMASTLVHRGPDDEGIWVEPESGIGFGFRRLAIIDLSMAGHQPMTSACGRWVLQFNGEIYDYTGLRARLGLTDADLRGSSDTEVLLAAFSRWGVRRALELCNGMFAIAVWDTRDKTLTLARDRLGEKPLYYGWAGGTFLFGSELKALRAHPDFAHDIDRDALTLFLRHNYVPAPHSIYQGISKLPPGHLLEVSATARSRPPEPYWSLKDVVADGKSRQLDWDDTTATDNLERELTRAVGMRMVADVPLGAFLSGGIDSSTVVALMQTQSSRPVKTFTIGFAEDGYDEAAAARDVARHLGTDHTELYLTAQDAMDVIPSLPTMYDEPFADSSQIPTHLVSRLASRDVTVALSGDGGDELLGGYTRYLLLERLWGSLRHIPPAARRTAARAILSVRPNAWDSAARGVSRVLPARLHQSHPGDKAHKLARLLPASSPGELYLDLVSAWRRPEDVVIGGREPTTLLTGADGRAPAGPLTPWAMYLDTATYLPDDILAKVDRASMAVSLEARVPLLDHHLVELAWRLPHHQKVRGGRGKWLLREVLARHVPTGLTDRPKQGFGVPVGQWLRDDLRDWAEDLLDAERLAREGVLHPIPVRRLWEEHLSGAVDHTPGLWAVLMFQAWHADALAL